jgi:hypothetical protein
MLKFYFAYLKEKKITANLLWVRVKKNLLIVSDNI